MKVLLDKRFDLAPINGVEIIKISTPKDLENYENSEVSVICGSRAIAAAAEKLNFPNLKLVQLSSAGFDGVPIESYAQKNIAVANAGTVYSVPIAETVIFGILQIVKKIRKNPNNRHFKLTRGYNTITELAGKKILIMGAGNIGSAVADRLMGFEVEIDAYDPYCPMKPQFKKILRTINELKENMVRYDYIISTLPDNEQTRNFIDSELFVCMKKTAIIVNVGRKAVFNQNDFYLALKNRNIGGAVLDMFEKLPNPITNKFRRLRNVIVWPGLSAISKELNVRLTEHMTANVVAILESGEIKGVINGVK